jgi:aspartate aminotransferase
MNGPSNASTMPTELARLLEPQERFDAMRQQAMTHSGANLCDLAYANAYGGPAPGVMRALADALAEDRTLALQYTPYGGATIPRRLVARQLSTQHARLFHFRDVILTPGAMAALNIVFRAVRTSSASADEVIVVTPCWLDYPLYLAQLGMRAVMVDVDPNTMHLDLDAIAAALTPRTRALILSQPSNPSGVLYTRTELERLARILENTLHGEPPLLISDECHRDIRFDMAPFVSPVECYARTCIVYSFGKSLFIQGQRIGYAAVSPDMPDREAFAARLVQWTRAMGFCTPTALMQQALPYLIDLQPELSTIAQRRVRMIEGLQRAGYSSPHSDATFFLYPRTPHGDDFAFAEALSAEGVLVLPAPLFHHRGHFRISVTASDEMIDRALDVFASHGVEPSPALAVMP